MRCLGCRANITNLAIAEAARQLSPDLQTKVAYEMSTYGSTYEFFKRHCARLESSEFIPGAQPGEMVGAVRNEDAQNLSFADCSFDLVTSNQVFEHVPDIAKCLQECLRVLKPGGSLLFTVPLYEAAATQQVATMEAGEIRWLAEPEYHSSRSTGPNSVPVFWRFSVHDILRWTASVPFQHVAFFPVTLCQVQSHPQLVIHGVK